jgi:hypothetical protein
VGRNIPDALKISKSLTLPPTVDLEQAFLLRGYQRCAESDTVVSTDSSTVVYLAYSKPGFSTRTVQPTIIVTTAPVRVYMGGSWGIRYASQVLAAVLRDSSGHLIASSEPGEESMSAVPDLSAAETQELGLLELSSSTISPQDGLDFTKLFIETEMMLAAHRVRTVIHNNVPCEHQKAIVGVVAAAGFVFASDVALAAVGYQAATGAGLAAAAGRFLACMPGSPSHVYDSHQ